MMLPDRLNTIIGRRYLLQETLGHGGMGMVYRALDRLTGQQVALKCVLTAEMGLEFTSNNGLTDFRVSLAQEFKLLASLRHPNIIAVLDYGFDQNREPYYTMELLDNAQTLLEAGKSCSIRTKVDLLVQMLQALAYLHRRGILHRDLKPANVLVVNGTAKVLDFGLSVMRDHAAQNPDLGMTSGTLGYIAPEVLIGHTAGETADLYGVGVIAYELFAGHHLFDMSDVGQLVNNILYTQPDIENVDISIPLGTILHRLLAKNPEDRYQSALEVIGALSKAMDHDIHIETEATRESFLQAARFIGREHELDQLANSLTSAIRGEGSLWLVAGESGVGKSRLVDELRTRALVDGVLVVQGHTVNAASVPYQMWRPMLGWLPLLHDLTQDEMIAIRTIAPGLVTLPSESGEGTTLDPHTAQARILNLVRETLQPMLVILEDLHWAGSESLSLLAQLLAMVKELKLLIVASYRDEEKPDLPTQFPAAHVLKLQRLSENQIAELSAAMLGDTGSQPHVVDLLRRETEGNVFFIIEVIRTLAEEAGQLEQIGLMTLPEQVFAGGMWRIIQRRLEHIPDYARPLLQLAAVSGRQQDTALLQALVPEINLERWLVDCANASVLEVVDSQWRFTHDKLREGVLDGLSLVQRQKLHGQVATAIEKLYGVASDRIPALAYHWGMAEVDAKEAVYTRLAGEQALRSGAYREAINYLDRALDLQPKDAFGDRIAVKHKLAEAHLGVGGYERAKRLYRDSLKLAEQLQDKDAQAAALARLGDIAYAQLQHEEAQTLYTESHDLYQELNDSIGIARVLNSLGSVAYDLGDNQTAKRLYQESLALTREAGTGWSMAGALRVDNHAAASRDTQEFQQLLDDLDHHIEAGNRTGVIDALYLLGETAADRGKTAEAREYLRKSASAARDLEYHRETARAYYALAMLELRLDERTEARKHFHNALKAARSAHDTPLALQVLYGIAQYYHTGSIADRAIELLAFILYHPDASDTLQDSAETLAFDLQTQIAPNILETLWERGKNHQFDTLTLDVLKEL